MRDHLRRYRAIRDAFTQEYPGQPTGTVARPLTPLAALISGIVARQSPQLPTIAAPVADGTQPESRVQRFARWSTNDGGTAAGDCIPYAEVLLAHLALQTLVLVMAGSGVGRGGVALRLHVVYNGRALPGAWLVRPGKNGPLPEALHSAWVAQGQDRIPAGARGVCLGAGAFDGTRLQHTGHADRWSSVGRTGSHIPVVWAGACFRCETVGACSKPGPRVA
jgi:hypothetical protein